jgi:hypothetical protein
VEEEEVGMGEVLAYMETTWWTEEEEEVVIQTLNQEIF